MDYQGECNVSVKKTREKLGRFYIALERVPEGTRYRTLGTMTVDELDAIRMMPHGVLVLDTDDGRTAEFVITSTKTGSIELLGVLSPSDGREGADEPS